MTHIYVLTFKLTDEKFYYTTLAAVAADHSKKEMKISPSTIRCLKFKNSNVYDNRLIKIEKVVLRKKNDVLRDKAARLNIS